jgi:ribonuclease J
MGTNRQFDIKEGDTIVLSSHPIPGNEEPIYRMINRLIERGANVIYEEIAAVHVSGHASQEEMKLLLHLVRPKYFIPIHGELRQLTQHARLAQEVGIPAENIQVIQNGQVIEISEKGMRQNGRVPAGEIFVDGSGVGDVNHDIMHQREELAQDGLVLVHANIDRFTGEILGEPQITTFGFISLEENAEFVPNLKNKVIDTIKRSGPKDRNELNRVIQSYIYAETRRKPVVFCTTGKS